MSATNPRPLLSRLVAEQIRIEEERHQKKPGLPTDFAAYGFDWSGTISDDLLAAYAAAAKRARAMGVAVEPTATDWARHPASTPEAEILMKQAEEDPPIVIREMTPQRYRKMFEEMYVEIVSHREEGHTNPLAPVPLPGAIEALRKFKARAIQRGASGTRPVFFLLSACPPSTLAKEVEEYGLGDFFDFGIFGGVSEKWSILRNIAQKFPDGSMVYVGDTIGDVNAAKRAGVKSAAVEGYHSMQMLLERAPDFAYSSLASALSLADDCDRI